MVAKKSIGKLNAYFDRLKADKAEKIKPSHVDKVIAKLTSKKQALEKELREASKDAKKDRLKGKLAVVEEQLKRGAWLKDNIE